MGTGAKRRMVFVGGRGEAMSDSSAWTAASLVDGVALGIARLFLEPMSALELELA